MQVAQRGTSSTTNGFGSVDRFQGQHSGTDENPTQEQVDVASGTTPYTSGFRKAFRITNGNQTSGAGATDLINIQYKLEAQDIANSGWNYTSASSYITLSFWIKSSVAQTFKGHLRTKDGTEQRYAFETGSLTADTWTKVTKTISGDSNLTFDNNNGEGVQINIAAFWGTDYTDNSVTENVWAAHSSGARMKDNTSTWYTTNDATLEITGVQLQVGSVATDFEHRSYAQELALCQRYYYRWTAGAANKYLWMGMATSTSSCFGIILELPVTMRATPTASAVGTFDPFGNDGSSAGHAAFSSTAIDHNTVDRLATTGWSGASGISGAGQAVVVRASATADYIDASAEL